MEEVVNTTKAAIEDFKESLLWKDMVAEVLRCKALAMLEYDIVGEPHIDDEGHKIVPNSSETLIHLGDIKGRRKACDYFLSIPDILLSIIEEQKNDTECTSPD
jgi:hypothetical protein